jgi:ectoine hydroxylase-related dioxygenase (phytanoyl-CoA dioxygenase family)
MLTPDQVALYQSQGFLKGSRKLDDAQLEILREETERVIRDKGQPVPQPVLLHNIGQGERKIWQIVDIWMASAPFAKLVRHADIAAEVAQLTGAAELRLWHDQIQYKVAETGGVNMWHQDWPYWGVLDAPHQLTAWVALDDVAVDNGCMSMVPGSHLWGNQINELHKLKNYDDLPTTFQGRAIERRYCPVAKGEVHYHHALTWHGSHANTSGRPRRAIALHYMTEQTRYKASGIHPMKPHIKVADGAKLEGDAFPVVWRR